MEEAHTQKEIERPTPMETDESFQLQLDEKAAKPVQDPENAAAATSLIRLHTNKDPQDLEMGDAAHKDADAEISAEAKAVEVSNPREGLDIMKVKEKTQDTGDEMISLEARNASDDLVHTTILADLEANYSSLQRDHAALQKSAAEQSLQLAQMTSTIQKLQTQTLVQTEETSTHIRLAELEKIRRQEAEEEAKLHKERLDRLAAENDELRAELSRSNAKNSALSKSLNQLESESKLSTSSAIPLRLDLERSRRETDAVSAHSKWLQDELETKTKEWADSQAKFTAEISHYRVQTMTLQSERTLLQNQVNSLQSIQQKLETQLESSQQSLQILKQEQINELQRYQEELNAEQNLVRLQTRHATNLEEHAKSLRRELDNVRQLASEAQAEQTRQKELWSEEMHEALQVVEEKSQKALDLVRSELQTLQKENSELKRDLHLIEQRRANRRSNVSVVAVEGESSSAIVPADMPSSFTDLLDRLTDVEEELQEERAERKRIELLFKKTQLEIEAKTPIIRAQRREYQQGIKFQEQARGQLEAANHQVDILTHQLKKVEAQSSTQCKEMNLLEREAHDLARQVQSLLKGKVSNNSDLVEFTNIEELQEQNRKLVQQQIRLESRLEELEIALNENSLKRGLDTAREELEDLREQREHQAVLVSGIVQQRDMYRALLAKQDSSLVAAGAAESGTPGTSIVSSFASPNKSQIMQKELEATHDELSKTRVELMHSKSEVFGLQERVKRLDALASELTSSLGKKDGELLAVNSARARSEAEVSFLRDKCTRLEENLQTSRADHSVTALARTEMQRINEELQTSLSLVKIEAQKHEQELIQAKAKMRRLEAQIETSRQSETRLAAEAEAARADLSRQGALLDSVQRIEAGLASRSAEEWEILKDEIQAMKKQTTKDKEAHEAELGKLKHQSDDLELQVKIAERDKEAAVRELLDVKKSATDAGAEALEAKKKITQLTSTCSELESALAEAKEKLTEISSLTTDKAKDEKIESLTSQLQLATYDLANIKERLATYQKIAKEHETNHAELVKSTDVFKAQQMTEMEELMRKLLASQKEAEAKQVALNEIGDELMTHRTLHEKELNELQSKIFTLQEECNSAKKDKAAMALQLSKITDEVISYKADAIASKNNYERELALHSEARNELRKLRNELETETKYRSEAISQIKALEQEKDAIEQQSKSERQSLQAIINQAEKRIAETREQNELLHKQVANLATAVEEMQKAKEADVKPSESEGASTNELASLRSNIAELREVIRFMRSEREILDGQVEALKRSTERERAAAVLARKSLEEARTELQVMQGEMHGQPTADIAELNEVKKKNSQLEEQVVLVRESNLLLREESEKLKAKVLDLEKTEQTAKLALEPFETKIRVLELKQATLESEKESLARESEAWKGRVQSLVSKFHPIDPEEHKQALAKVAELKMQLENLKAESAKIEIERNSAKALIARLNKESAQHRSNLEAAEKNIASLKSENEILAKTSSESAGTITKERDDLKKMLDSKTSELASLNTDLLGQKRRVENFTRMLRQYKEKMTDLTTKSAAVEQEAAKSQGVLKQKIQEQESLIEKQKRDLEELHKSGLQAASIEGSTEKRTSLTNEPVADKGKDAEVVEEPEKEKITSVPEIPTEGFRFAPSEATFESSTSIDVVLQEGGTSDKTIDPKAGEKIESGQNRESELKKEEVVSDGNPPVFSPKLSDQEQKEQKAAVLREKLLLKRKRLKELAERKAALEEKQLNNEESVQEAVSSPAPKLSRPDNAPTVTSTNDNSDTKKITDSAVVEESSSIETGKATKALTKDNSVKPLDLTTEGGNVKQKDSTNKTDLAPSLGSSVPPSEFQTIGGPVDSSASGSAVTFGSAFGVPKTGHSSSSPNFGLEPSSSTQVFGSSFATPVLGASLAASEQKSSDGFSLNLVPPGTTTSTTFTFGNTANIKLAIPSKPSGASSSPFTTFSRSISANNTLVFGSAVPKPLFTEPLQASKKRSSETVDDGSSKKERLDDHTTSQNEDGANPTDLS